MFELYCFIFIHPVKLLRLIKQKCFLIILSHLIYIVSLCRKLYKNFKMSTVTQVYIAYVFPNVWYSVCKCQNEIRIPENPENSKRDIETFYRVIMVRDKGHSMCRMTGNLFCFVFLVLGASQGTVGGTPNRQIKRGALSYVVGQGCPYLSQ